MVCDPEIWKQVFKQTGDFPEETLKRLVAFCSRDLVCPEIRSEVLKVAARGMVYNPGTSWHGSVYGRMEFKITLTIQGWNDPELFAVDGGRLEELANIEEKVGVHATILSVQQYEKCRCGGWSWVGLGWECGCNYLLDLEKVVKNILARDLGKLEKLELKHVNLRGELPYKDRNPENPLTLMRASKSWRVNVLHIDDASFDSWFPLVGSSNIGDIKHLVVFPSEPLPEDLEDMGKEYLSRLGSPESLTVLEVLFFPPTFGR